MKKKLLLPIIGMLSLVASAASETAHIYEIRPWNWGAVDASGKLTSGVVTNEQSSVTSPIEGGETFYFVVRLLNPDWKNVGNATNAWRFVAYDQVTGLPVSDTDELIKWCTTPPEIGIVVSGKTIGAKVERCEPDYAYNPTSATSKYYTDIICSYTVKPGDLALPVRLAADGNGNPITADTGSLYIYNSDLWKLAYGSEEAILKFQNNFDTPLEYTTYGNPPDEKGYERGLDYDLSRCAFYLRTVDFTDSDNADRTWYDTGVWRGVHKSSEKTKRSKASITVTGNPTVATTLYVWSDDDNKVTLPDGTSETILDKSETLVSRNVLKIDIRAGKEVYTFNLRGTGNEDDTANLYLSQFKGHTFTSHTLNNDYLSIPVKVLAQEQPSLSFTPNPYTDSVPADQNKVSTALAVLELNISGGYQDYASELNVTVTPALEDASSAATDYVHIAMADDTDKFAWTNSTPVKIRVSKTVGDPDYDEAFASGSDVTRSINVYGLGADEHTSTINHTVNLNITHDGSTTFFTGGADTGVLFLTPEKPVLSVPASHAAIGNVNRTFELTVKDNYKNFNDAAGYTILYKQSEEDDWETLTGTFKPNAFGVLTNGVATLPALSYVPGTFTTTFKVKTPGGDVESDEVSTVVTVSEPARVNGLILLEDGTTATTGVYEESDYTMIDVAAELSRAYTKADAIYAYLAPANDTTLACVKGNMLTNTAASASAGMKILKGDTISDKGELYIIDGGAGSGTTLSFDIVLCTTPTYDPTKVLGSSAYQSKTFKLTAKNKAPVVNSVTVDNLYTVENSGDTLGAKVSIDVPKTFTFDIGDVAADLKATASGEEFRLQYSIVEGNGSGSAKTILTGDPAMTNFTYKFKYAGKATIKLWVRDKDIANFSTTPDFTFYVDVLDYPSISISNSFGGDIAEGKIGLADSKMTLNLSENSSSTPLDIEIEVKSANTDTSVDAGLLMLGGVNVTNKIDSVTGLPVTNVYCITLNPGQTSYDFYITKSDGTLVSQVNGFVLTPKVTTTNAIPLLTGKTWDNYYVSEPTAIVVRNVAPTIFCSLGEENVSTNGFQGAIGNNDAITWSVDDVSALDINKGLTCQWWSTDYGYETATNVTTTGEISYTPRFKSSGIKIIRLTVTDKDKSSGNGTTTKSWYYDVAPSKTLKTVALGPSRGTGNSLVSQRYAAADGIGAGHVFAAGDFSGAEGFTLSWNCGLDLMVDVWAWGYKVNTSDDGNLDGSKQYERDVPLDPYGNNSTDGKTTLSSYYSYTPQDNLDSFFYALLFTSVEEGSSVVSSSIYGSTVAPEFQGRAVAYNRIALPDTTSGDSGKYLDTIVEAVFAKEFDTNDNMGDIDQDGLPDYFAVEKIWKTGSPLVEIDGVGGELGNGAALNDDGDYLPTEAQLTSGATISGAGWDSPFTARLEARGFHKGLNYGMFPITDGEGWVSDIDMSDAEKKALIEYAKADTKNVAEATALTNSVTTVSAWLVLPDDYTAAEYDTYTNEQAIAKAYISKTWSGYSKANPTKWGFTVENRTDPTQWDTDGDNIPDGYEYYYWYAATVGYDDVGTPMTGEKFNLADIESPVAISSAEIISLFNPTVAAPVDWKKRDSDADGLYDFEEYAIGTNPVHWDTDKDGLSDLFEIMWNVDAFKGSGDSASNGASNTDGDYMAVVQGYKTCPIVNVTALGKNYAKVASVTNYVDSGTNFEVAVGFEVARFNGGWIPTASAFSESDERGVAFVLWDDPGTSTANYTTVTTSGRIDLYHNQVYSYYGFDPRTGWFKPDRDYGNEYPNSAKFTAKDEFLLLKYRYITGLRTLDNTDPKNKGDLQKLADDETTIAAIFKAGTTNPSASFEEKTYGSESASYIRTASELHGADSDGDAVPDGWELYVGANPNVKDTSDTKTVGTKLGLLAKEFAGTTCSAIYSACPTIVANRPKAEGSVIFGWLNKFWPVDPGSDDTDGDGITDKEEGNASWSEKLIYGRWGQTKVSNIGGTSVFVSHRAQYGDVNDVDDDDDVRPSYKGCYGGGGYNPCSIDTDKDGLPDRWERQYSGVLFYRDDFADNAFAEGSAIPDPDVDDEKRASIHAYYNPLSNWGYYVAMGMDATVPDSQADFDFDGLTNWQEYMVQALRHLRYDDCVHPLNGYDMPTVNALTDSTVPGNFTGKYLKLSLAEGYDELSGTDRDAVLGTILDLGYTNFVNFISSEAGEDYLVKLGYFGKPPYDWDPANSISGSTTVSVTDETGTTTTTESEGFRYMRPPRFAKLRATEVYDYTNKDGDGNEIWTGFENTLMLVGGVPVFTPTATPITFTNVAGSVAAPVGTVGSVMQFSALPASRVGGDFSRVYTNALLVVTNYLPVVGYTNYYYMLESPVLASNVVMTTWSSAIKFVSTDPRLWDTDEDGQDDYWELFHGLNPLLGSATDVIADAYVFGISSTENAFTGWADMSGTPPYDPIKTPWLVGAADADADGDGLRNYEEGLLVNLTEPTSTHTDPTPLWMTDTTIPAVEIPVTAEEETVETAFFDYGGITVPYSQSVTNTVTNSFVTVYQSPSYAAQFYEVPWTGNNNWVDEGYFLDFEENEGYDTDGDWRSDRTELTRGVEPISDPLAFGDPSSRQSVTLGDGGMKGVLIGYSPIERSNYVRNADFLKHFTVEAWINPASTTTGTKQYVVSRAVNTAGWDTFNTAPVIRHNFAIGIATNGHVFAEFDDSTDGMAYAEGGAIASGKWTHVAATYDGEILRVMVDGAESGEAPTKEIPVTGAKGILQDAARDRVVDFPVAGYSCDPAVIIIGGRAIGNGSFGAEVAAAATSWNDVATDFFKGSVDEVRVWHGARTAAQVEADRKTRFSTEQVKELRLANLAGEYGDVELVHHYNFSTLPGAEAKLHVQQMPAGFTNNVLAAVNTDVGTDALKVGWWNAIVTNSVFAGQVYRSGHIVPWVKDTVGHLPALLGEVSDSEFWTEYLAGYTPVTFQGVDKFEFPNSMNPYTLVRRPSIVLSAYHTKYQAGNYTDAELYSTLDFLGKYDARHAFSGTKDLVPIGDVYAKRLTDSWDGQGAETAWAVTTDNSTANPDGDMDNNGIPEWAVAAGYTSERVYARDLAKGLLPTGSIDSNYENTEDIDGDGLRDWWEKFYDIYDEGPNDDNDFDGLSNYQEYLISEVYTSFGFTNLSPTVAKSSGKGVSDYFLRFDGTKDTSLYLGELFSDHDMIEDKWEDGEPSVISLGGTLRSNFSRWLYDANWDADRDGWDGWSIARAWFNESYVTNIVTEVGDVAVTNRYLASAVDDNNGNPTPMIPIHVTYRDKAGRHPYIGSASNPHQVIVKVWSLEGGNADKGFGAPDCIWGGALKGESGVYELKGFASGYAASKGAIKPGRNMFVAYIAEGEWEEEGSVPEYEPAMPYGVIVAEVGPIGGANVNIELTDTNPSIVRINIPATLEIQRGSGESNVPLTDGTSSDAKTLLAQVAGLYTDRGLDAVATPKYIGPDTTLASSNIHIRVLRSGINLMEKSADKTVTFSSSDVLLDRYINIGVNNMLTEADLLSALPSGKGDLDWNGLSSGISKLGKSNVTNATYRIVIGDGTVESNVNNNNLIAVFINKFEALATQTPVSSMSRGTFVGRPTFSWKHDNTIGKDYPAFRLRVWDGDDDSLVYDSGVQRAPARDQSGYYNWAPPLYVGEMLANDKVFKANKNYKWSVSMLDAKFTEPLANEEKQTFKMQETSPGPGSDDYGIIKVAVKYMGPGTIASNVSTNCIRVEAFTTPDFTGEPVGVGYVTNTVNVKSEMIVDEVNARIVGLPQRTEKGTVQYYVRAFLDTDVTSDEGGYGKRAPWESWGYACYRDPTLKNSRAFTPCPVTATNIEKAEADCVVYIEDCDTNQNMVPDILEKTAAGATTLYSPYIAYTASYAVKTNALVSAMDGANGDKNSVKRTRSLLAFAKSGTTGAYESGVLTPAERAVLDGYLSVSTIDSAYIKITSFSLEDGISLEIDVDGTLADTATAAFDTGVINVTVEYSETLENGGVWQREGDVVTLAFSLTQPTTKIEATELGAIKAAIESAKAKCDGGCYFRVSAVAFER